MHSGFVFSFLSACYPLSSWRCLVLLHPWWLLHPSVWLSSLDAFMIFFIEKTENDRQKQRFWKRQLAAGGTTKQWYRDLPEEVDELVSGQKSRFVLFQFDHLCACSYNMLPVPVLILQFFVLTLQAELREGEVEERGFWIECGTNTCALNSWAIRKIWQV